MGAPWRKPWRRAAAAPRAARSPTRRRGRPSIAKHILRSTIYEVVLRGAAMMRRVSADAGLAILRAARIRILMCLCSPSGWAHLPNMAGSPSTRGRRPEAAPRGTTRACTPAACRFRTCDDTRPHDAWSRHCAAEVRSCNALQAVALLAVIVPLEDRVLDPLRGRQRTPQCKVACRPGWAATRRKVEASVWSPERSGSCP